MPPHRHQTTNHPEHRQPSRPPRPSTFTVLLVHLFGALGRMGTCSVLWRTSPVLSHLFSAVVHLSSAVALVQCCCTCSVLWSTSPVLLHLFSALVHLFSAVALVQCDALCQCFGALLSVPMLHPCTVPVLSWCDTDFELTGSRQ